jgi:hypothetical protein
MLATYMSADSGSKYLHRDQLAFKLEAERHAKTKAAKSNLGKLKVRVRLVTWMVYLPELTGTLRVFHSVHIHTCCLNLWCMSQLYRITQRVSQNHASCANL